IHMKKGRPGLLVTCLAAPEKRHALEEILFSESTTLGVRRQEWERTALERELVPVRTAYGPVAVKVGRRGGRVYNAQPEFDDCDRAAGAAGVPVKEVWAAALAAFRQL
ncbi:MAG TPA: nickel insertion protein, partial [Vicinamibacteria bacterium]|nr:nickel insertion protein [Vicinamibacteria bacterium]